MAMEILDILILLCGHFDNSTKQTLYDRNETCGKRTIDKNISIIDKV